MCGRAYKTYTDQELIYRYLNSRPPAFPDLKPNYNMTPSQESWAVRISEGKKELALMRWGLVPFWAKDIKSTERYSLINAKAEEVREKRSYKSAFEKRRCIVPVSGFFEWKKEGSSRKRPYCIRLKNEPIMSLAGIWESWRGNEKDEPLLSFSILTTTANEALNPIHERMPVILDRMDEELWLRSDSEADRLALLKPCPAEWIDVYPISTLVNSPKNNSPEILQPI
jgi:putative SOS response-associated peptidase YedK